MVGVSSNNWAEARHRFDRDVMPSLKTRGEDIGKAARADDADAKAVMHYYTLLHRSWDPVTADRLRTVLDRWLAAHPVAPPNPGA